MYNLSVKNPPTNAGDVKTWAGALDGEYPLEEGMVTHSSILAWWATFHGVSELDTTEVT